MALITTATTDQAATNPTTTKKRVHFGDNEIHEIPEDELDPTSWYDASDMKDSFRADVIAFLKAFKRNQQREIYGDDDEDSDSGSEDENEDELICSRGLEMYYPGEISMRRRLRTIYSENVLRKHKDLNDIFDDDKDEAAEHLQQFASALSENAQKKAHALALQDALEARLVYTEGLRGEEGNMKPLDIFPIIKHNSKTELTTSKARAA